MHLLIYAGQLRESGGRAIGLGLLRALSQGQWSHRITAVVPEDESFLGLESPALAVVPIHTQGGIGQILASGKVTKIINELRPDALYMLGNRPLPDSNCPQAVHVCLPWAVYPESIAWRTLSPAERFVMKTRVQMTLQNLTKASIVTTQTELMMRRIQKVTGLPYDRLALVPNAFSALPGLPDEVSLVADAIRKSPFKTKLICVARYMPHKNLEVLVKVADRLVEAGINDIGIFLTLSDHQGKGARKMIDAITRNGRSNVIVNLGEIPITQLAECYKAVDALVFPSLLEAFSGVYVDCMYLSVPILTSDLDFAHEVCGDAAVYFDPLNPDSIIDAIATLNNQSSMWISRLGIGHKIVNASAMDWNTIASKVISIMESVYRAPRVHYHLISNI